MQKTDVICIFPFTEDTTWLTEFCRSWIQELYKVLNFFFKVFTEQYLQLFIVFLLKQFWDVIPLG